MYVKTKNFHWHLAGPRFRDYHLLLDEQATSVLESIDALPERVRKIGGATIRSIGHIGRLQMIRDDNDEYVPALDMIRRLLADNREIAERQRAAIELLLDDAGKVREIRLFIRPLPGLATLTAALAPRLARHRSRWRAVAMSLLVDPLAFMTRAGEGIVARLVKPLTRTTWSGAGTGR